MKPFKKMLLLTGIGLIYIVMAYITFLAVVKVHRTNDPSVAKKIVILTFFADLFMFTGSGYLIYKLKIPMDKT